MSHFHNSVDLSLCTFRALRNTSYQPKVWIKVWVVVRTSLAGMIVMYGPAAELDNVGGVSAQSGSQ